MKTKIGKEYGLSDLEERFDGSDFRFEGSDLYGEGKPSEFLTIDGKEQFVWSGHIDATGAVYQRVK